MENLIQDMLRDVVERGIEKATAINSLRALSSWFGGQQLYIPQKKEGSAVAEEILGVMSDAVGDIDAEKIYDILSLLYGGVLWYIPIEKNAFRDIIAEEIMKEYDGTTQSMRDLCRRYNISYTQVYRLYSEGFEKKRQREFNF
ncbi:Mor transcription activator family protein [Treponema denticola]|uniref:Mor transcription activator family protein n=1 Tax=Treponema denticola TaxID=158 RepID=UPI0020A4EB36|nr:Mor transcription activator family protein [Treponema denticola]UTC87887.1 hypothetical protein E4N79_06910 [Treponema denticola]